MTTSAAIQSLTDIAKFFFGGHAKFTLVSKNSGDRKTFQVRARDEHRDFFFVELLVGPDNGSDYRYLCCIWRRTTDGIWQAKLNKDRWGAEAYAAFVWLLAWVNNPVTVVAHRFFDQCEFWHAGACSRCGRELTDPESIARGLGPVCAERS